MGTVTNPLSGLIEGLLQGHALATQMHHQQQQDQAFKTQQILDNQRLHSEQIMDQMRDADNKAKLADDYRPVSDLGTVQDQMNLTIPGSRGNPGSLGAASVSMLRGGEQQPDLYNLPQQGGASMPGPQFTTERKADGARTTTYQGRKYERKTPEELRARDLERHIGEQSALERASVKAKGEADEAELDRKRKLVGVPVPADLAQLFPAAQYPHGLLEQEIMTARAGVAGGQKTQAETAKLKAEGDKAQMIADAMKRGQGAIGTGAHPIDAIFPSTLDPQINKSYKAAYDSAMTAPPDANGRHEPAEQLLNAAAQHAAQISLAGNPKVIEGAAKKAGAEAGARVPFEVSAAVQKELQLAKLSGSAFAMITDPYERHKAEDQYDAANKDYIATVAESRRLKDLITSAQGGNKAAPGLIPIEELRGFVSRTNRQELQMVSAGAGSAYDRIQGFIKGYTEGQPIPPSILRDTASLADLSEKSSGRKYTLSLGAIRAKGAKVTPINADQILGAAPGGAPAVGAVQEGYRFKGGDPSQQGNWERVK